MDKKQLDKIKTDLAIAISLGRQESQERNRRELQSLDEQRKKARERRAKLEQEALRILKEIPTRVRKAEAAGRQSIRIFVLKSSDWTFSIKEGESYLTGVAEIIFDCCKNLKLNPRVVEVSDAGVDDPDAGSHQEIEISWHNLDLF